MRKILFYGFLTCLLFSCKESKTERIASLIKSWQNRTVFYPPGAELLSFRGDSIYQYTIKHTDYAIVSYIDSVGCTSCKLQLPEWEKLIATIDSVSGGSVPCLFFFHPKSKKELVSLLKRTHFSYPVCVDDTDSLNKLNHFPTDVMFQTFLVDKNRKVLAIGNPVYNPQVKALYLNIISGKGVGTKVERKSTEIMLSEKVIDFGKFDWHTSQYCTFTIQNRGKNLLVIDDVVVSCGCTTVEYSKEPVPSGDSLAITVTYTADHPEYFSKTTTVYCNTAISPLQLNIVGNTIE